MEICLLGQHNYIHQEVAEMMRQRSKAARPGRHKQTAAARTLRTLTEQSDSIGRPPRHCNEARILNSTHNRVRHGRAAHTISTVPWIGACLLGEFGHVPIKA